MIASKRKHLGARPLPGGVQFRVWAPNASRVNVMLEDYEERFAMARTEDGYFELLVPGIGAGTLYKYRMEGHMPYPDPASRFQPQGVHGPSQVVDPDAYPWQHNDWQGIAHKDLVFYELHVGTFTPEGSYRATIEKLPYLRDLGVTAVELMPLGDFPGRWNWGYDPAAFFAPSRAYGTPDELRELVDTAHGLGMAVFLDVIYNHFGPDGAYVVAFAPQVFTEKWHTPWGQAINFDGAESEHVEEFFVQNALHWFEEYRFDGLRLDATFALYDEGPEHFLAVLAGAVLPLSPKRYLIAEDYRNLNLISLPVNKGGYGLDGVWADDFHHQMRRIVAGDKHGYFSDFADSTEDLARLINQGWLFTGEGVPPHRGIPGTPTDDLLPEQFVFCIQNHDQVGNRPQGNRLSDDVTLDVYKAATAVLLFVPALPLLFQGQEWATKTPFYFFTDHNPELGKLVQEGRKEEFQYFPGFGGDVPDPQDERTFEASVLDWAEADRAPHRGILRLYHDLLKLRHDLKGKVEATSPLEGALVIRRKKHLLVVALKGGLTVPLPEKGTERWQSEAEAYDDDPQPAKVHKREVTFSRAGAVLLEL